MVLWPLALCAAIPPSTIKPPPRFADYDKGYGIQFPDDWRWQKKFMGLDAFACSPAESKDQRSEANLSVVAVALPENQKREEFFKTSLETLKNGLNKFQIVETGKVAFNGFQGHMVDYTHTTKNDQQLRVKQYFIVENGIGIIITGSCTNAQSYQYLPIFEQHAKTLKFY